MADTTITGNNVYPASLAVPTPGDSVKAAVAPGAVRPGYQALINGMAAAQTQLYGRLARYHVVGSDNNNLAIGRVGSFVVKNGSGDWQAYADTTNGTAWGGAGTFLTVDPTALYGAALTDGRYWVYLKAPTGADPFDVVVLKDTTAANEPDENLMYRKSDQTHILLSTFYVYNTLLIPYMQIGGRFVYKERTSTGFGMAAGNLILRNGNATASTAVNFGNSVPYTPMFVTIIFQVNRSGTGFRGAAGGEPVALTTGAANDVDLWGDGTVTSSSTGQFETLGNGSQFYYMVDNASAFANAWVGGFQLW